MASYFFARKKKRPPVVADPKLWSTSSADDDRPFHAEPKSESEKQQLVTALKDHYVFSALSTNDILQVIHRMRKRSFASGNEICTEGSSGDEFFVLAAGECDIIVKGEKVGAYKPGQSFGELALLYSCTRAATIKATSSCTCWAVDAATFRKVAIRSKQGAARGRLDFLKKVPLLQGLDSGTLQRVADALKRVEFAAGSKIVTEGEPGDDFYLIEDGEVKCTKKNGSDEQHLMTLKRGDYFGEMALMLDEPRHATVTSTRPTKCFAISSHDFSRLFGPLRDLIQQQMRMRILKSVPLLSHLDDHVLDKLADAMRIQLFDSGKYVIKEGDKGSRFYIINAGAAKVTKNTKTGEEDIGVLNANEFFGERALLSAEPRQANIIATEALECLVLDRDSFKKWLADVDDVRQKKAARDARRVAARPKAQDLQRLRTLGTGTFGRVSLVVHTPTNKVYALKAMQKSQIAETHQERNVQAEKDLLLECAHPFVLALVATYQDEHRLYMLMEIIQGGELWSLIYEKVDATRSLRSGGCGAFEQSSAKFFAGCVIEAFAHIHGKSVAYRDLKPENLLLDERGYVKVIDFGFAKRVPFVDDGGNRQDRTYTICGTPEYLAPEIVRSEGHTTAVDLWALGCLVYELLVGRTPFADDSQSTIFRTIMRSKKVLNESKTWPRGFPSEGKALVKALLDDAPSYRLGAGRDGLDSVKKHAFFRGFDWKSLSDMSQKAPYVPPIKNAMDTRNFDPYDERDPLKPFRGDQRTFSGWSEMGADFPPQKV